MKAGVVCCGVLTVSVTCLSIGYVYKMLRERRYTQLLLAYDEKKKEVPAVIKAAEEEVKAAEEQSKRNPSDPQMLKKWASALIKLAIMMRWGKRRGNQVNLCLRDAKSKLEQALEINPDDLETKFELGNVIFYLLTYSDVRMNYKVYIELCRTAIDYLEEVRNKEPGVYKNSKLEDIKHFLPLDDAELEDTDDDEMDDEVWTSIFIQHKWENAKIKITRNAGKNEQKSNDIIAKLCKGILIDPHDSR